MSSSQNRPKLVVILGPTAVGKSAVALSLTKRFGGEIVSADSRQIYKGMDIGTSKPTTTEQKRIRHHLIDIASPTTVITLVDWQRQTHQAIKGTLARKKVPFLIGGTGLYLSSIIDEYRIPQKKGTPRYDTLILGMTLPRAELNSRIDTRVRLMVRKGLEKEIRSLAKRYPWSLPSMHGIGYREWRPYLNGSATKQQTIVAIQQATRNFAKRQMTWFRRMERQGNHIEWVPSAPEAEALIRRFLHRS